LPRHAWWQAVLAFLALQQVCRWLTPPAANINLAFAVWQGWEARFPSYPAYLAMLVGLALPPADRRPARTGWPAAPSAPVSRMARRTSSGVRTTRSPPPSAMATARTQRR
jgi:hypothetical protein